MKNEKLFKKLVVIMLILVFVLVSATSVLAADDDLFKEINKTENTQQGTENTNNDTPTQNTQPTNNSNTNSNVSSLTTNSNTNNTNNTNSNINTTRNVSNTNELAKTGLSNTGSIITLILVICGISAIYSYKKVNDYKKL